MELSKNKIKYLSQFAKKKASEEAGKFIVEGNKMVEELLASEFSVECVVATAEWLAGHRPCCECFEATHEEISRISLLKNPQDVWALANRKPQTEPDGLQGLVIALDGVQDPGNLGTIIRLADWFGVSHVVCSHECVDVYNPKVVQATMGAVFRVKVSYVDLPEFLSSVQGFDVLAADMQGENIYTTEVPQNAIIVMGNEGNGISGKVSQCVTKAVHIPSFNKTGKTSESLNVAVATAVICSEIKRRCL